MMEKAFVKLKGFSFLYCGVFNLCRLFSKGAFFYLRMEWDGWMGWGIKSVLQFSLYFVGI